MGIPGDIQSEITAIKDRIQQIQIDIGELLSSTSSPTVPTNKAEEFQRISEELASLRTRLAFIMGRAPR